MYSTYSSNIIKSAVVSLYRIIFIFSAQSKTIAFTNDKVILSNTDIMQILNISNTKVE